MRTKFSLLITFPLSVIFIFLWLSLLSACKTPIQKNTGETGIKPGDQIPTFTFQAPTAFTEPTTRATVEPKPAQLTVVNLKEANLIIEFSQTDRLIRTIEVREPISGLAFLKNSNLEVITADFGGGMIGICSIAGVGCPAENCFCSDKFWSYESWDGTSWQPYSTGALTTLVNAGAIEGWRWAEFGVGSLPPAPDLLASKKAFEWLARIQNPDSGGYADPSSSLEVLLALNSNHIDAGDWRVEEGKHSLLDYWQAEYLSYGQKGIAERGKLLAGLASTSCLPNDLPLVLDDYKADTGVYSEHAGFQAWAILGSLSISQTIDIEATNYLKNLAQADGGWEWNIGFGSDSNTTALVLQTLIATGEPLGSPIIMDGLEYLKSAQNSDGGFTYQPGSSYGTASDANSTAYAIQAILAAGEDPVSGRWGVDSANPVQYLRNLQLPDGSFEWQAGTGTNLIASAQVATALLGRTFPLSNLAVPICK